MGNKYVLLLTLIYIGGTSVTNALALWQPQIIKAYDLTTMQVGLLNSVPFAIASLAMYLWATHSDRTGERTWHTALPLGRGDARAGLHHAGAFAGADDPGAVRRHHVRVHDQRAVLGTGDGDAAGWASPHSRSARSTR